MTTIEKMYTILDPFSAEVLMKEYYLKTTEITNNDALNEIFSEIREVILKYENQINENLEVFFPGTKINVT